MEGNARVARCPPSSEMRTIVSVREFGWRLIAVRTSRENVYRTGGDTSPLIFACYNSVRIRLTVKGRRI